MVIPTRSFHCNPQRHYTTAYHTSSSSTILKRQNLQKPPCPCPPRCLGPRCNPISAYVMMLAFSAPVPLRPTQQPENRCGTQRQPLLTLAENPSAPAPGKRVPTFKKLQRRHRRGPASFRRTQREQQQQQQERTPQEKKKQKKRPTTGRPGTPLCELFVGQQLDGIVQNIVPHGAFLDIGATRDGLVHVRDMAIDFVHTPRDVVRSGMKVQVWVKYVDPVRDVLGLTMVKPALGFEGRSKIVDFEVGSRYHGIIERVTNYGAYIDISAERLAFLHVSGAWGKNPRETLEYMRIGDRVWVSIVGLDEQKGFIRLFARGNDGERLTKESPLDEIIEEHDPVSLSQDLVLERPWDEMKAEKEDHETEVSDESEESDDEEDDERNEFDFVNQDEDGSTIRFQDLDQVAHMFNNDTEFVDTTIDDS